MTLIAQYTEQGKVVWKKLKSGPEMVLLFPNSTLSSLQSRYQKLKKRQGATRASVIELADAMATRESECQANIVGSSIPTVPEEIRLNRLYSKAMKQGCKAVNKPRLPIPKTYLEWANNTFSSEGSRKGTSNIQYASKVLAAISYAIHSQNTFLTSEKRKETARRRKTVRQVLDDNRKLMSWISQELNRRKTRKPPTAKQKRILRTLSKLRLFKNPGEGKLSNAVLKRRYSRCREMIIKVKEEIERREEEGKRKAIRRRGLSYFRKASEGHSHFTANECREYWSGIVGIAASPDMERVRKWLPSPVNEPSLRMTDEEWDAITGQVVSQVKPCRAAGPDGIHGFYWKHIPSARVFLKTWIQYILQGQGKINTPLCEGRVVLIPKGNQPNHPSAARPITCLNISLKCLNATMASVIEPAITRKLPPEQNAVKKGCWGVTEARAIDGMITHASSRSKKPMCAWIDFSKAFDSISHEYIRRLLAHINIPEIIRKTYSDFLKLCSVRYEVRNGFEVTKSVPLDIKRGVPQGDTLSPMIFCLAVSPISNALNQQMIGYRVRYKNQNTYVTMHYNHVFFADDLKVYAEREEDLKTGIAAVKNCAEAINLTLNPSKCAISQDITRVPSRLPVTFPVLRDGCTYKYLGIEQNQGDSVISTLQKLEPELFAKTQAIWESSLTHKQKTSAFRTLVSPCIAFVTQNTFACQKGTKGTEILTWASGFDQRVRYILVDLNARNRTCVRCRLYLPTHKLGFGLVSIRDMCENAIAYGYAYLAVKETLDFAWQMCARDTSNRRNIIKDFNRITYGTGLQTERSLNSNGRPFLRVNGEEQSEASSAGRAIVNALNEHRISTRMEEWQTKECGQALFKKEYKLDHEDSARWIMKGTLNSTSVRNIFAVQDFQVFTNRKDTTRSSNCRQCGAPSESVGHIVSECPTFRNTLMVDRHNGVARQLHYYLCQQYGFPTTHYSQRVAEELINDKTSLFYDHSFPFEDKIRHYRPDIVLVDNEKKQTTVIEIGVSYFSRLCEQEYRKYAKYAINSTLESDTHERPWPHGATLAGELRKRYGWPVRVMAIVIGCCGEMTASVRNNLKDLPNMTTRKLDDLIARIGITTVLGTDRVIKVHLSAKNC